MIIKTRRNHSLTCIYLNIILITALVCCPAIGFSQTEDESSGSSEPAVEQTESQQPESEQQQPLDDGSLSGNGGSENQVPTFSQNSVNVDPHSGSANMGYGIDVPAGRGGIQPSIAFNYNSSMHNGPLGVGWAMELGTIERSTKKGIPQYNGNDTFVLKQNGSAQELVFDDTVGFYRSKDEGAFMKVEFNGTFWTITDKKGIEYIFGETSASRSANPSYSSKVFSWHLNHVEDIHDNSMDITYITVVNRLYPSLIEYTKNETQGITNGFAKVAFSYETLTYPQTNYISGYNRGLYRLLNRIDVKTVVDGVDKFQRTYKFGYEDSTVTFRPLLTSIQQFAPNSAYDNYDPAQSLPAVTFEYQQEKGFALDSGWTIPVNFADNSKDQGVRVADINSDGFPDLIRDHSDCGTPRENIWIHNGDKSWDVGGWTFPTLNKPIMYTCGEEQKEFGIRVADINGDARPDVVMNYFEGGEMIESFLNSLGDGYERWDVDNDNWGLPNKEITKSEAWGNVYQGVVLADVNGDNFPDYIQSRNNPDGAPIRNAYLNNQLNDGKGWMAENGAWSLPESGAADLNRGATLVDLNGDGLNDIYYLVGGTPVAYIHYGNRSSENYWNSETGGWVDIASGGSVLDGSIQFADINSDGLVDAIENSSVNSARVFINTGTRFVEDSSWVNNWTQFGGNFLNFGTRLMDVNGDGMVDFVKANSGEAKAVFLNMGKPADLLIRSDNGVSGTSTINYGPSTQYNNHFLPFPVQVVQSVTVSNSIGDSFTTTYEYEGGLWDSDEREFRGFEKVTVKDATDAYSKTYYDQGLYLKGRILKQEAFDSSGVKRGETINEWLTKEVTPGEDIHFSYLAQVNNKSYDNQGNFLDETAQQFTYDDNAANPKFGNLTKAIQLGDINEEGDERTVETEYHNVTNSQYFIGIPKTTRVLDESGAKVRESWFYYDGNENVETEPTEGLLTKKEDWAGDDAEDINPTAQYSYDDFGNLETTTDAMDHVTSITYDPDYHMFPLMTTNPLNHSATNQYYGVNGVLLDDGSGLRGLWGQMRSTTDPNNQTGERCYDRHGRLEASISPLDTLDYPTTMVEYDFDSDYTRVINEQRIEHGEAATIQSIQFFDGLGRQLKTKTISEEPGTYVVSGEVEYDTRGLPVKQYVPRFVTSPFTALDPLDTNVAHSTLYYDDLGRVWKTENPDGTWAEVRYQGRTTVTIDENGHRQESEVDAYGRLIAKREYTGSDGRLPGVYPATPGGSVDNYYDLYSETTYDYDSEGNLVTVTDQLGNITTITYDYLGRKISMIDPDMGMWSYTYDVNGNLKTQTDQIGQVITFDYDELNRLLNKSGEVDYTYDSAGQSYGKGRLTKASYINDYTDFVYDALGREITSTKEIDSNQFDVRRTYDALNRLATVEYPDGMQVAYTYNRAGQIELVADEQVIIDDSEDPEDPGDGTQTPIANARIHFNFNETNGTTITNTGNLGSTGVSSPDNAALSLAGEHISNSFTFNDSSHKVEIDSSIINGIRQDAVGSISLWIKPNGTQNGNIFGFRSDYDAMFLLQVNEFGTVSFHVQGLDASGYPPRFLINSFYDYLVNINEWSHITITQDGVGYKLYKNGVLQIPTRTRQGEMPSAWLKTITDVNINYINNGRIGCSGQGQACDGNYKGGVDDFRYYNFALSPEEVITLYYGGIGTEEENPVGDPTIPADTFEDFTTFTVNDPTGTLTTSTQCLSYGLTETRATNAYAYKTQLVSGNFTHFVEMNQNSTWANSGPVLFWGLSDTPGETYNDWNNGLVVGVSRDSGVGYIYRLGEVVNGTFTVLAESTELGTSYTSYYVSINRNGNLVTVNVYTDAAHTALFDSFSSTVNVPESFDYVYAYSMRDIAQTSHKTIGATCRLMLNPTVEEEPPVLPDTVYIRDVDYNAAGQISFIEYGNGDLKYYQYDNNLRLSHLKTFSQNGDVISFDEDGFPTGTGDLQDLSYLYDGVGNITTITDAIDVSKSEHFVYDEFSRLVEADGDYGLKTYTYDVLGNITEKDGRLYLYDQIGNAGPHAVTSLTDGTSFTYDLNGNMTSMDKSGEMWEYAYDDENRLISVTKNTKLQAEYEYDGDGGRTKKTTYSYSTGGGGCFLAGTEILMADGSVKNIEDVRIGDEIMSYDERTMELSPSTVSRTFVKDDVFDYLVLNNSLRVTKEHPFFVQGNWMKADKLSVADHLMTDGLTEISLENIEKVNAPDAVKVYNIEVSGNHNYFVGLVSGDSLQGTANRGSGEGQGLQNNSLPLTTINGQLSTKFVLVHNKGENSTGGLGFLNKDKPFFHNLIESAATFSDTMFGIKDAYAETITTKETVFVGSLYDRDGNGDDRSYVYLGDTRIATVDDNGIHFMHGNHLGSTDVIADEMGTIEEKITYEPYGKINSHDKYGSSDEVSDFYFTGQRLDTESGLMYYNARYYDPSLGRFITPDTIVQAAMSNPQTMNRYSYTGNNPVNRIDPTGHSFWKKAWNWFKKNTIVGGFIDALGTGDWAQFGRQVAVLTISAFANVLVPGFGATLSSNFFVNAGLHILRGAAVGAAVGGITSTIMGGSFAQGAMIGGITGGVMGAFQGVTTSEQYQNWRGGNGFKSNSQVEALHAKQDAEAMAALGVDPKDVQNTDQFQEYMDFVKKQGVERTADQPFILEKVHDSLDGVPDFIKNYEPKDAWGGLADDLGAHGWNQRLPGGYHLGIDKGDPNVYLHFDAYNPLNGPVSTVQHGVFEVYRHPAPTPQDNYPDWSQN